MAEDFQVVAPRMRSHSPTLRDIAAVLFRHKRLLSISFCLALVAGLMYTVIFPSYRAEMKVLVRRGRIDPVVTPTQTASPAFEHDEISEEDMNSEVEMLRDADILRAVATENGMGHASWISKLRNQSPEPRIEKSVQRLAAKLEVHPTRKSRLITISFPTAVRCGAEGVL